MTWKVEQQEPAVLSQWINHQVPGAGRPAQSVDQYQRFTFTNRLECQHRLSFEHPLATCTLGQLFRTVVRTPEAACLKGHSILAAESRDDPGAADFSPVENETLQQQSVLNSLEKCGAIWSK